MEIKGFWALDIGNKNPTRGVEFFLVELFETYLEQCSFFARNNVFSSNCHKWQKSR